MSWLLAAVVLGLIVFWPATCELARLAHRVRTRRIENLANQTATCTPARKETP
jgi:hypothetical protein